MLPVVSAHGEDSRLSDNLVRLDSAIAARRTLAVGRRHEIDRLKRDLAASMHDTARYSVLRELYRLYRRSRCDSALVIAGERLTIARKTGDRGRIQSASLNLAESYGLVGDPRSSLHILDTMSRYDMEPYHLRYLYDTYIKCYGSLAKREVIPDSRIRLERKAELYSDSALRMYDDGEVAYYRIRSKILSSKGHDAEALNTMIYAEARLGLASANDNALLANLYGKCGDSARAMEYMSKAAIIDVSEGTMTHGWLMRLALMLSDHGDYGRAHRYLRIALDDASSAVAKGLTQEILEAVPLVDDAYADHERELFGWQLGFGFTAVLAALSLALALWMTRRQLRVTRKARNEATALNAELEEANSRLRISNTQRSVVLNEFFEAYSDAIEQRKELRKHIGRLLKTGQRSRAEEVVSSRSMDDNSIQDLYSRFDRMVASLSPEFADEFNSKVPENHRITDDTLSSEARVLALIRLGITSSGNIARLLHYSAQTVYNYRSRLRSWGFLD